MALASEARHNRKTTEENSWFNPENLLLLATAEASQTLAKFDGIKKTRNFNQNNKTSMKISTFILALVHWPPFLQRLYGDLQKKTFCSTSVKIKLLSVFFFYFLFTLQSKKHSWNAIFILVFLILIKNFKNLIALWFLQNYHWQLVSFIKALSPTYFSKPVFWCFVTKKQIFRSELC